MRWEYKAEMFRYNNVLDVNIGDTSHFKGKPALEIDILNKLGDDGWEMCGMSEHSDKGYRFFFKRPAPESVEQAPAVEI